MNKERIKERCAQIAQVLKDGMTPQEIAEIFHPDNIIEHNDNNEYVYYYIDFYDLKFGISFLRYYDSNVWWWENDDEIYMFDHKGWAHWKQL